MVKKTDKISKEGVDFKNENSYEKLRDELFEYRVDIQAYKRSVNVLCACVSIIVAILGFFGYNRIEALLEKVEQNANERLEKTDELLAQVDIQYLDSLTTIVEARTKSYEAAISALERGTRVNNDLYKKLINGLPYNIKSEERILSYTDRDAINIFDIVFYDSSYSYGATGECYVVMGEEYKPQADDIFLVEVFPKNRNVTVYYQTFVVQSNYNKFYFKFKEFEQYKDYLLSVVLLQKKGGTTYGYHMSKHIMVR